MTAKTSVDSVAIKGNNARPTDQDYFLDSSPKTTIGFPRLTDCKTQSPADRELREQLHQHRYLMFQHGLTVREIAESEGVDERQIYLSISHREARLPKSEVMANRNFRNALVAYRKLSEKYVQTLAALMDGKGGKNWNQRSRALQHFRRTVGLEGGGGVQINTEVTVGAGVSYEERLERIRAAQEEAAFHAQHVGPRLIEKRTGGASALLSSGPDLES